MERRKAALRDHLQLRGIDPKSLLSSQNITQLCLGDVLGFVTFAPTKAAATRGLLRLLHFEESAPMTVNYNLALSNSGPISRFKILFRWKGSVWKAVWFEYMIWISLYMIFSMVYRFALHDHQKVTFNKVAKYIESKADYVPMNFMLGFFVTTVVSRWTTIFTNIGILDNVSLMAAAHIKGDSEECRMIRRTIVRYCVLAQTIVLRDISLQVRKRFPTLDTVVVGRIMLPHEKLKFEALDDGYAKHWMPFGWAMDLANRARRKGYIDSEIRVDSLIAEIKTFRTMMATLRNYDWVPLPIMYPQLIFLCVHVFFGFALVSRQFTEEGDGVDLYFPVMSSMQFIFYIGWMKVAEALLNPMGEDDDDFECNWLIDRNLRIGLSIVDEGYDTTPELSKDEFWGTLDIKPLYAAGSRSVNALEGSVAHVDLPDNIREVEMLPLSDEDNIFGASTQSSRRPSRNSNQRRISIVDKRLQNGVGSPSSAMGNLRKRLSRFNSKPSAASLGDLEKAAYINEGLSRPASFDDAHHRGSVELAVPSDYLNSPTRRVFFEDSHGEPFKFDESIKAPSTASSGQPSADGRNHHNHSRAPSNEHIHFNASHSVANPHQVVGDTISEADEGDQGSSSRHSSEGNIKM